MRDFVQEVPECRIVFAAGAEARAAENLTDLGAERVVLVCTERHRAGADRVAASLGERCVGVLATAVPQVPGEVADAAVEVIRSWNADWVLAHGGGTAIGLAKAVALELDVSIGALTTTYSGSEMTNIYGITRGGVKTTGRDERVRPRLVLYDPEQVAGLRIEIARNSLFNAMAHSVDALLDDEASHLHDEAEASVGALVAGLRGLADDPDSVEAAADALYGSFLAGRALDGARMALQHKLAHTLGGSFGTPHAQTHAVLLPHTLAFNRTPAASRRLRRALGSSDPEAALFDLAVATGIPTRLSEIGFSRTDIPRAVSLALDKQYPNPVPLTREGIHALLEDAVLGRRPSADRRRFPLEGVSGPHGGIDAARIGPEPRDAAAVLIAAHGRGATAESMLDKVRDLLPPDVCVLAPQAADNTWYPKGFRDPEANQPHLDSALEVLDACWSAAVEWVDPSKIAVLGWSQGACLAISWLSRAPGRPGALIAWTGAAIPGLDTFDDLGRTRTVLGTCERDPWVSLDEVRATAEALRDGGTTPELHVATGDVHEVREADRLALARTLEVLVTGDDLETLSGYGAAHLSEARPNAVPRHQNAPLDPKYGLYAEQINGTGFTVERQRNQRIWLYRIRPQIPLKPWERVDNGRFAGHFDQGVPTPEILRYRPLPLPAEPTDFVRGLVTFAGAGSPETRTGLAIHAYGATADMTDRCFSNADGDLLVVPYEGALRIRSEMGWLHVSVGEIAILPRGIRYQVLLPDGHSRGFVSELFNGHYELPQRGPVGANGLADERHFKAPVADFEDRPVAFEHIHKHGGALWRTELSHSPFDVVGWHGNYLPFKYDLLDFTAMWSVTHDHSDPSILTVLTHPHDDHGRNAVDFAVFRGRWDPTEHTFRPPFLHRNAAIEFNAVIATPATSGPYTTGAFTYTPYLSPHGVSAGTYERERQRAEAGDDSPLRRPDEELWIQWESTYPMRVMPWILDADERDTEYLDQFRGMIPARP